MKKVATLVFALATAYAPLSSASIIIPSDYAVNASVAFDDINSYQVNSIQNDAIGINSDTTSINNSIVTGSNPLNGALTDGLTINTSLMNGVDDVDFESIFYDFEVNLENNSASNEAEFFFNFNYFQSAVVEVSDVNFDDALVDSTLSLYDDSFNEIFSSYLFADSFSGADSTFGDFDFSFKLAAGEALSFSGSVNVSGYDFGEAYFEQTTSSILSLTQIVETSTSVPEPSSALLLLLPSLLLLRKKS